MGKSVSKAERLDLREPGLVFFIIPDQYLLRDGVQDVARKSADHAKESKLLDVEKSFTRKNSSHKEDKWLWGVLMEFEEILGGLFNMIGDYVDFGFTENECSKTREQDRQAKDLVSPEGRERISPVTAGHASKQEAC